MTHLVNVTFPGYSEKHIAVMEVLLEGHKDFKVLAEICDKRENNGILIETNQNGLPILDHLSICDMLVYKELEL